MMNTNKIIAQELLKIKAVFLRPEQPFVWASGIKSPIYCDNRLIISYPETRNVVENALASMIKINFPNTKAVVGTATAGIPHAAYVSTILNMPMAYVRSKIKDHGRAKHIEGEIPLSAPIVIVEDLISTGGSSHEVYKILEKEGYNIIGLVSIFSYNTKKANAIFNDAKIKHLSLTSLDDLLDVALDDKIINNNQKIDILKFRDSL